MAQLKFMTWNVEKLALQDLQAQDFDRLNYVAHALAASGADLACFQETDYGNRCMIGDYLVLKLNELASHRSWKYLASPPILGGAPKGGNWLQECYLTLYDENKLIPAPTVKYELPSGLLRGLASSFTMKISPPAKNEQVGKVDYTLVINNANVFKRPPFYQRFQILGEDYKVGILNVHLRAGGKALTLERSEELQFLVRLPPFKATHDRERGDRLEINELGEPTFILGDFNADFNSPLGGDDPDPLSYMKKKLATIDSVFSNRESKPKDERWLGTLLKQDSMSFPQKGSYDYRQSRKSDPPPPPPTVGEIGRTIDNILYNFNSREFTILNHTQAGDVVLDLIKQYFSGGYESRERDYEGNFNFDLLQSFGPQLLFRPGPNGTTKDISAWLRQLSTIVVSQTTNDGKPTNTQIKEWKSSNRDALLHNGWCRYLGGISDHLPVVMEMTVTRNASEPSEER